MTLEQVLAVMRQMEAEHKTTVRLHTGDPCLYGAIREQMDALDADGIAYDDTPGVSSFCGAAAALNAEYTLPAVSQTVIITRMEAPEGRTSTRWRRPCACATTRKTPTRADSGKTVKRFRCRSEVRWQERWWSEETQH